MHHNHIYIWMITDPLISLTKSSFLEPSFTLITGVVSGIAPQKYAGMHAPAFISWTDYSFEMRILGL